MRQLAAIPGVGFTKVYYNAFGVPWLKPTVFMHNTPTLHELAEGTGEVTFPSVRLRGRVCVDGQMVFRTALASTYPVLLASTYARLLADALFLKQEAARLGLPAPLMPLAESAGCPMGSEVVFGSVTLLSRAEVRRLGEVSGMSSRAAALPCVPDGWGQPRGLTVDEQVLWMQSAPHPLDLGQLQLDQDLREAVEYEARHEPQAIDAMRSLELSRISELAQGLQQEQVEWTLEAPEPIRGLVSRIHGPLILALMQEMDYEDQGLLQDLQRGFPYVGELPACGIAVRPGTPKPLGLLTPAELRAMRKDSNDTVVRRLRSTEWDDDVMRQTLDDVEFGAMSGPWPLNEVETSRISLSRRLPVREERGAGWRTRDVDHKTESSVNLATQPRDKLAHDTIDVMIGMLRLYVMMGMAPLLWKRDIGMAFRRLAVCADHLDLTWVCFMYQGVQMVAQHLGMPFGTTSAVHAWHRAGAFLLAVVRRICHAPAARYVDDYFGCSRQGVVWHGGACLDVIAELVGLPCKAEKSVQQMGELVVLGAKVAVCLATQTVSVRIDDAKADKWRKACLHLLAEGTCTPTSAMKMAGRLTFAVTVSMGKVGRAYVKPFFAQAYHPLSRNRVGPLLGRACRWWADYLELRPELSVCADSSQRRRVQAWTDASGESRTLSAVIQVGGVWKYTYMRVPDEVWVQFLPRGDAQICMQELLAVPLLLSTFREDLESALVLLAIDNQGVLHSIINGRGGAEDLNLAVGAVWLDLARMQVALHVVRVESAANIADGPSRDRFEDVVGRGAELVSPVLPDWCYHLWEW